MLYSLLVLFSTALAGHQPQANSLLHQTAYVYSQRGEDGILAEILKRVGIDKGFFVEFGAADGIMFSNTRLLMEQGWEGAYIESDASLFKTLCRNCENFPNVICVNQFITWDPSDTKGMTFDQIADLHFPDREIDFLSIDVDGADHLILENLVRRPKILCVEGGFSWNPLFTERVPDSVAMENLQQPLYVMFQIGKQLGYEPVCFTQNTFFVRNDLYAPFKGIKNTPLILWRDAWYHYKELQEWLLHFRATNPLIRNTEGAKYATLRLGSRRFR